ncbi:hypothetical protein IEQ34_003506 [Dendrobium chrysotoxum]|uniref:Uncharacterized protein n=1 Tax=Dendrobium chrysotoxum TaxID=161865 RepID=A0AAV7HLG9_DENCH|nr:hypothetical protein IEQ34_003506 [Dendrobium chrysotoxum]
MAVSSLHQDSVLPDFLPLDDMMSPPMVHSNCWIGDRRGFSYPPQCKKRIPDVTGDTLHVESDLRCGLEHFSDLLQCYPNNVRILLEIAKTEATFGRIEEAIMNFEKVRSIDPFVLTYMDEYAMFLNSKFDHSKLNKLVYDLLNIDPARAEAFVAKYCGDGKMNEEPWLTLRTSSELVIDIFWST